MRFIESWVTKEQNCLLEYQGSFCTKIERSYIWFLQATFCQPIFGKLTLNFSELCSRKLILWLKPILSWTKHISSHDFFCMDYSNKTSLWFLKNRANSLWKSPINSSLSKIMCVCCECGCCFSHLLFLGENSKIVLCFLE